MTHPWPELVGKLEALDLAPILLEPEALGAAMAERERLIADLSAADPAQLEPAQRSELRSRIARVHERDQELLAALYTLRDTTREQLERAGVGMRAMNGYRQTVSAEPAPYRRIG